MRTNILIGLSCSQTVRSKNKGIIRSLIHDTHDVTTRDKSKVNSSNASKPDKSMKFRI